MEGYDAWKEGSGCRDEIELGLHDARARVCEIQLQLNRKPIYDLGYSDAHLRYASIGISVQRKPRHPSCTVK